MDDKARCGRCGHWDHEAKVLERGNPYNQRTVGDGDEFRVCSLLSDRYDEFPLFTGADFYCDGFTSKEQA